MFLKNYNEIETICLDLSNSIPYKKKKGLIDLLAAHGFKISFIINKFTNLLIKDDRDNLDTYKCRTAFKLGIPVVHVDFVYELYLNLNSNAKMEEFIIKNKQEEINFKNGYISTLPSEFILK